MRISNGNIENLGSAGVGSVGGSDGRSSSGVASAKSDSVNLSNASNLVALAKASTPLRQANIQSLSAQVKSGTYQADDAQVSQALVEGHISS